MSKQRGKGEGSIRPRKDGRWEARITVGLTPTGNPKQRSVYGKTRAEVAKKLTEMLANQDQGLLTEPNKATVAAYVERMISNRVNVTEGTRYKLRCEVKPILNILGAMRLQDLHTPHVRDAYTALAAKGLVDTCPAQGRISP